MTGKVIVVIDTDNANYKEALACKYALTGEYTLQQFDEGAEMLFYELSASRINSKLVVQVSIDQLIHASDIEGLLGLTYNEASVSAHRYIIGKKDVAEFDEDCLITPR